MVEISKEAFEARVRKAVRKQVTEATAEMRANDERLRNANSALEKQLIEAGEKITRLLSEIADLKKNPSLAERKKATVEASEASNLRTENKYLEDALSQANKRIQELARQLSEKEDLLKRLQQINAKLRQDLIDVNKKLLLLSKEEDSGDKQQESKSSKLSPSAEEIDAKCKKLRGKETKTHEDAKKLIFEIIPLFANLGEQEYTKMRRVFRESFRGTGITKESLLKECSQEIKEALEFLLSF